MAGGRPPLSSAPVTRPARIAIQVDSLLAGGAERVAVEVACALDPARFAPLVLVTRGSGPLEPLLLESGVETIVLGRSGRMFSPRKLARAVRAVRSCDLLHVHKLEGAAWGSLIARLARRPLVAHEHIWFGEPNRTRRLLYRFLIGPSAARIVCVSSVVTQSVIDDGAPAGKVTTIPNGVRTGLAISREEARAELGLAPEAQVIGIVARLRPQKRHDALLRAVAILDAEDREFVCCVLGDGPRREELEQLAHDLGIEHRLLFAGERPAAARLFPAFDVSVICSSSEGLPLAGLEAMASGVPLVATAVSALPELLGGGAGILVPLGDDPALARAIAAVLDDSGLAARLAATAVARVEQLYTFEGMIAALESLYDEVLGRSREADAR